MVNGAVSSITSSVLTCWILRDLHQHTNSESITVESNWEIGAFIHKAEKEARAVINEINECIINMKDPKNKGISLCP